MAARFADTTTPQEGPWSWIALAVRVVKSEIELRFW